MQEKRILSLAMRLGTNAMMAALCAALGFVAIDLGNIKLTLEGFPILLGALLFGPVDGMAIAFVGTFLSQLLGYGLTLTTLLWILPYVIAALAVGMYAKWKAFDLIRSQVILITVVGEFLILIFNTVALVIDSKIYGYYGAYIFAATVPRLAICVCKSVVFGVVLYQLIGSVKKALKW